MVGKLFAAATVTAAVVMALVVVPASAAYASIPICTTSIELQSGGLFIVPAYGTNQSCGLYQGDGPDEAVDALQDNINLCYISPGHLTQYGISPSQTLTVDGQFGAKTEAALVATQRYITGITVDGKYGPQTRSHMKWYNGFAGEGGCLTVPL